MSKAKGSENGLDISAGSPSGLKFFLRKRLATLSYRTPLLKRRQRRCDPPWKILMYHRVVEPESVGYPLQPGMYVRPETFKKHAAYLNKECSVMPLDRLLESIATGKPIPPRTLALTFDDGWLDTFDTALPILKEFDLPATVFLATSFIGNERLFWTDEAARSLERLWRNNRKELNAISSGDEAVPAGLLEVFPLLRTSKTFTDALEKLIATLKQNSLAERRESMSFLMERTAQFERKRHFMNWDEVREMDKAGICFGSHSHSHRYLSELNAVDISQELEASKQAFATQGIQNLTPSFCYPGGVFSFAAHGHMRALRVPAAIGTARDSYLHVEPPILGRVGIHEDVSSTTGLFGFRVWYR